MNAKINHIAVWVLVVVYFLVGWGWYAIWGDTWLNLHAKTATDIERTHSVSPWCGLKLALACWFAFVFMEYATISVFSAFETNPWPLICIDMGRPLIGFAISGIVLGAWRQRDVASS
jgi:hypothetical protein